MFRTRDPDIRKPPTQTSDIGVYAVSILGYVAVIALRTLIITLHHTPIVIFPNETLQINRKESEGTSWAAIATSPPPGRLTA